MGDVARKVMGDVPISYIEGVGGIRVSEDEIVAVGKHDVGAFTRSSFAFPRLTKPFYIGAFVQTWPIDPAIQFMYSQRDNETTLEMI